MPYRDTNTDETGNHTEKYIERYNITPGEYNYELLRATR